MNLVIKSPNNFEIIDGKLTSETKFEVTKQGDILIISSEDNQNILINGNNMTISNNYGNCIGVSKGSTSIGVCGDFRNIHISQKNISFNGYTFNFKNGELYINGIKFVEDKTKSETIKKEEVKENEYLEYELTKESIKSISISSSTMLIIDDLSVLNDENLNIMIQGSGTVLTSFDGYFIKNLNLTVQGSGDIKINNFQSNNCNCSVQGSGDIILRESNFNTLNLNVMGSGDITGKNTTAEKISKNVIGSGDINGF